MKGGKKMDDGTCIQYFVTRADAEDVLRALKAEWPAAHVVSKLNPLQKFYTIAGDQAETKFLRENGYVF